MKQFFMNDLPLIVYLKENLKYGCIGLMTFKEVIVRDEKNPIKDLVVELYPYSEFFENDRHYIRVNVLESMELRNMMGFSLKHLQMSSDKILAVYSFQ